MELRQELQEPLQGWLSETDKPQNPYLTSSASAGEFGAASSVPTTSYDFCRIGSDRTVADPRCIGFATWYGVGGGDLA